jgi:hypothetical protein
MDAETADKIVLTGEDKKKNQTLNEWNKVRHYKMWQYMYCTSNIDEFKNETPWKIKHNKYKFEG